MSPATAELQARSLAIALNATQRALSLPRLQHREDEEIFGCPYCEDAEGGCPECNPGGVRCLTCLDQAEIEIRGRMVACPDCNADGAR